MLGRTSLQRLVKVKDVPETWEVWEHLDPVQRDFCRDSPKGLWEHSPTKFGNQNREQSSFQSKKILEVEPQMQLQEGSQGKAPCCLNVIILKRRW